MDYFHGKDPLVKKKFDSQWKIQYTEYENNY